MERLNPEEPGKPIRLAFCGDVMTGRGLDQVMSCPSDPLLYESYLHDARSYVNLAERASGPIPKPIGADYIWGDSLGVLKSADARIINLETSITTSEKAWPGKGIHYRMHPRNIECMIAARVSCCCLANNHVLDWGYPGLEETIRTLDAAGLPHAGAGKNAATASAPARIETPDGRDIAVFAFGCETSGIPREWSATTTQAGVNLLPDLSIGTAKRVADQIRRESGPADLIVVSIHWGGNWGYGIPHEQVRFAHWLTEEGAAVVHGHSSHHPRPFEVHNGRLILYGAGDFINDYEGIGGYEEFRGDLRLVFLATLATGGELTRLQIIPMHALQFRLSKASASDIRWLLDLLNRVGKDFGTQATLEGEDEIAVSIAR